MHNTPFDQFWQAYPRRVSKGRARKAFDKALRKTDLQAILDGVEKYKLCKPDYADWAHAATWLNDERWDDEWDTPGSAIDAALMEAARRADEEEESSDEQHTRASGNLRLV